MSEKSEDEYGWKNEIKGPHLFIELSSTRFLRIFKNSNVQIE